MSLWQLGLLRVMELSWLVLYAGAEDVLSFQGDNEGFMGDVSSSFSRVPTCPVEIDIELFALNKVANINSPSPSVWVLMSSV